MNAVMRFALLALLVLPASLVQAQQHFENPQAAADAFVAALGTTKADEKRLVALLGEDWRRYVPLVGVEREDVEAFLTLYREKNEIRSQAEGYSLLAVGEQGWELPLPLVHGKQGWGFDAKAGVPLIRQRRIGRNEEATLQAVRAYHDAQMDYAEVDRDGDGVLEYAQQFVSSKGQHDGLYWPDQNGEPPSPLGALFVDGLPSGGWHGYHYRILTAQGPSAPGGAYSYLLGQNMSRGFALVAWPVIYGDSGVMSFMISHDGSVFEKDLGPDGAKQASAMTRFDPDSSWQAVSDTDGAAGSQ